MGCIHQEPLSGFVQSLASEFGLTTFVETGTYLGDASAWAASVFPVVETIEVSPEFQQTAKAKYGHLANIGYHLGDSAAELEPIARTLSAPALFWLDAHAGGGHYGPQDNCPLLGELEAINQSPHEHFILIDDARGFTAPTPPPFDWRSWPSIDQVIMALKARNDYYVVIVHDTIIAVPQAAKERVVAFCHRVRPIMT